MCWKSNASSDPSPKRSFVQADPGTLRASAYACGAHCWSQAISLITNLAAWKAGRRDVLSEEAKLEANCREPNPFSGNSVGYTTG